MSLDSCNHHTPFSIMSVSQLPFEVLLRIANLLPIEEKLSCTTVCKAWKPLFQESLWNSLYIQNQRILENICDDSAPKHRIYQKNGSRVREIYVPKELAISKDQILTIQQMFQNIDILCAPLRVLKDSTLESFTGLYLWESLRSLEVTIDKLDSQTERMPSFLKAISYLPHLTWLKLLDNSAISLLVYSINDLEELHSNLPQLKHLFLNGKVSAITADDIKIFSHLTPAKYLAIAKLDLIDMDIAWIFYFLSKYSNIKTLHWSITKSLVAQEDFLDYINNQINSFRVPLKYLNKLTVQNTWEDEESYEYLYKAISNQKPQLRQIEYCKYITHYTEIQLYLLSDNLQSILLSFGSTLEIVSITTNADFSDMTGIIKALGGCPNLIDLCLNLSNSCIAVDIILDHCIGLKKLKLLGKTVVIYSNVPEKATPHGLYLIEFSRTIISTDIFYYISFRCRSLKCMRLNYMNVFGLITKSSKSIIVDMPYTDFDILLLNGVSFCAVHGNEYLARNAANLMLPIQPQFIVKRIKPLPNQRLPDTHQESGNEKVQIRIYWVPRNPRDALSVLFSKRREVMYAHEYSKLLEIQTINPTTKLTSLTSPIKIILKYLMKRHFFEESILFDCKSIDTYAMDGEVNKEEIKWKKFVNKIF
ncbi:hypothetical protein CLU79DRAFT_559809 [Phycomyces nitens]|nr:hypothetical protein CLU79DRAFT_559809 [Phycomyces nitens]